MSLEGLIAEAARRAMAIQPIWIGTYRKKRGRRVVHPYRDCWMLEQANRVRGPTIRGYYYQDAKTCMYCTGEMAPAGGSNALSQRLEAEDFGPEDLGLSPTETA